MAPLPVNWVPCSPLPMVGEGPGVRIDEAAGAEWNE